MDPLYVSNMVGSLDQTGVTQQQISAEMSSGVRINALSDDSVGAGQNVTLLNQIQTDDSFTQSANLVSGQLQVADSTLGSVVTQLTSAISMATSANNGTLNSSDLKTIVNQLTGVSAEVQSLANTNYQGQYIFGGAVVTTAPFTTTTNSTPNVTTYSGDQNVNYLETPNGQKIQLNIPGSQVFLGTGSNSVFGALNSLIADYSAVPVNTAQAVQDTEALGTALNYVSQQRVAVDNSISQVTAASDATTNVKLQLTSAQSTLMQADVAGLATQLSLSKTQQTALESMIATLDSSSNTLFSKL
jgi:flagellar hook-associated protein 3 FlgL